MTVRSAIKADLRSVATIHKSQFESHFLGQYSAKLLENFYGSLLGKAPFLVHETSEGVNGFLVGGSSETISACKTAFLHRNFLLCLWETLLRPRLWLASWRRGIRHTAPLLAIRGGSKKTSPLYQISILSIAVSKQAMGTGVAAKLIDAFERAIQGNHVDHYGLSVMKKNLCACRFYEKTGFEVIEDNGISLVLRKKLMGPNQ